MARAAAVSPASDLDSLERLASADPLTGLANRRGGERDISAEISRARRQTTPLSCLLLDIDHFKMVNDTSGHQAGDYVLREISELLRRTVRAYDILVRWGGEEFLIVLPGVTPEQARKLAERLRLAVEQMPLSGIDGVTASIGVRRSGRITPSTRCLRKPTAASTQQKQPGVTESRRAISFQLSAFSSVKFLLTADG